jgi:Xaa-Pro aminopeptidase
MDKYFYQQNRFRFFQKIDNEGMVIMFGSSALYVNEKGYYGRNLDMNFFYLTGLKTSSSIVVLWSEKGTYHERLFIEKPNPDEEKWSGIKMKSSRAAEISGVEDVVYLKSFKTFLRDMLTSTFIKTLFLDIPSWFKEDVPAPIDSFIRRTKADYSHIDIGNIGGILADMRTVKQPGEIDCIKKAVANAGAGIEAMLSCVRPGMYEYQLQAACHNLLYDRGEMESSPMVASGANAVILHYPESHAVIHEDDLVLVDFCPRSNYYAADISRAFPASGRFSQRQKELYNIALDANKRMIDAVKPGMTFKEMNGLCHKFLGDGMLSIGLISSRSEVEKYYYHNVSHYMGLDIHDVGNTDLPIPVNAVLTIDAGVYVAEEGIGMRVEDDVLITVDGCENLSGSIIKEIDDIEEYMAVRDGG